MKNTFILLLSLGALLSACIKEARVSPEILTICPPPGIIIQDSLTSGTYLSMTVGDGTENIYAAIQALTKTQKVTYVNVVGNVFNNLSQLENRIPLYQSVCLDEMVGTESGAQIAFEQNKVKSIYLNSGKELSQWPSNLKTAISIGDDISQLFGKLDQIRKNPTYTNKFERISLYTKNLDTIYDPIMTQSPQWYFAYMVAPGQMDEVKLHFAFGKLVKINVNHHIQN